MKKVFWILFLSVLGAVVPAFSQESRATIGGTVNDPQGAVVPGAAIHVKNLGTNVVTSVTTSERGIYLAPALNPGMYSVEVTAKGFKSTVRNNIELRVGDHVTLDVPLELGQTTESVLVTAEAPLLETASATSGTVFDKAAVANLPTLGRNPFSLMQYGAGQVHVAIVSASGAERPFDNGGMDYYSVNGGVNFSNEFLLDGSPNTTTEGYRTQASNLAFVPPPDAVGEFKMMSNLYDAEFGRTGGGVVNVSLKNGTNDFHGTAYWYLRNNVLNSNSVQSNAAGSKLNSFHWAQPGLQFQGPVILPHLYNGKNKSFFMYSLELVRSSIPAPASLTVPTALERQGDFSQTLYNGNAIAIYDPLTTLNPSTGVYSRTPFPDSKIPSSRINSIGSTLMGYYPLPNMVVARGLTNLVVSPDLNTDAYNAHTFRFDQVVGEKDRFFFTFTRSNRTQNGGGRQAFVAEGHPEAANTYDHWRVNHGATLNWTSMVSPTWFSTTRASFQRHQFAIMDLSYYSDASLAGWPKSLTSQLQHSAFPAVGLDYYTTLGRNGSSLDFANTYSLGETLSKVYKSHNLKFGGEVRTTRDNILNPTSMGTFNFNKSFTQANPLTGDVYSGDSVASALLGYLNSGTNSYNTQSAWNNHYYVAFVQDDWRIARKLTLNLGLRWDYESPMTDRFNHMVSGFDTSTPSHIGGLYTGPVVYGGLQYATADHRFNYHRDLNNFQPRLGVAYQASDKLVFRGGWGISYLPTNDYPSTTGYSTTTSVVGSVGGAGIVPLVTNGQSTLTNPYPDGINKPVGNSLGLRTNVGSSLAFYNANRNVTYVHSFSLGFQYQLPIRTLLDVSYVGSRTRAMEVDHGIDEITSAQYTSIGAGLLAAQTNPYAGLLPGTSLNSTTVTLQQLMRPWNQFTGITENGRNLGAARYNSLQLKLEKRLSAGLYVLFNYTWSKNLNRNTYLNGNYDAVGNLVSALDSRDIPHNINVSFTYKLPFAVHGPAVAKAVLGGWEVSGNLSSMSGPPIGMSTGAESTGVSPVLQGHTLNRWFNTCTVTVAGTRQNCASDTEQAAWKIRAPYTLTGTMTYFTNIRQYRPLQTNFSIFKSFRIWENVKTEFRAEAFNAFNTPMFGAPTVSASSSLFGYVARTQANDPRAMQMALKVSF
jgi:hypothetical protein